MSHDGNPFGHDNPFSDGVCAEYANTIITYSIMLVHREIEIRSPCVEVARERFQKFEERLSAMAAQHIAELSRLSDTIVNTAPDGTVPASN